MANFCFQRKSVLHSNTASYFRLTVFDFAIFDVGNQLRRKVHWLQSYNTDSLAHPRTRVYKLIHHLYAMIALRAEMLSKSNFIYSHMLRFAALTAAKTTPTFHVPFQGKVATGMEVRNKKKKNSDTTTGRGACVGPNPQHGSSRDPGNEVGGIGHTGFTKMANREDADQIKQGNKVNI